MQKNNIAWTKLCLTAITIADLALGGGGGFLGFSLWILYGIYTAIRYAVIKISEPEYTKDDMLRASKYGYDFHKTTQFPEHEFEQACINNTKQWLKYRKY